MRCQFTEDSDGEEIDFGHDFDLSWSGDECFQDKFIKTREALAFLVFGCCGSCGSKDLEISTCGTLWREIGQGDQDGHSFTKDHEGLDLVVFCGTDPRTRPTSAYLETLTQIASLDTALESDKPGVDIVIPSLSLYPCHVMSSDGGPNILKNVLKSEKMIHELWKSDKHKEVPAGQLRCTFVLNPLVADLEEITTWPEMATKVGKLITKSLCFSEIEMRVHRDPTYVGDERTSRLLFGELFCEAV
ncbi:hypothetical protein F441_23079 [Phytophthora nicotianae CJ01A1]|uniref:Uncharacterized protein n=4 Tax=Phytophthora nicotianae TaxID=4792 RepID=V9F6X3_PHYNI|nr:hypothetical protein F443_09464 [Phytophthora nicotianae P1569]ETK86062.1 hypothetical protein L915_09281 [Phytophthora nicotianae]ETO99511.1 hypothetical protein F441_23079 [Phytophthora nicotianae CJ01A1]ETP43985.1 hypothetical protein F442_09386 [Phytophthora nicotianae P10297]